MITYSVSPPDLQVIYEAWVTYRNDTDSFNEYFSNSRISELRSEDCRICLEKINWNERLKLSCGHTYHRTCVKDQAEAQLTNFFMTEIVCGLCNTPIDTHILQQLITEKDYERYSGELDVRKGTKVQCPNCEHYIEQDLNFNTGNPMPTSCRICSYQFCRLCTKH